MDITTAPSPVTHIHDRDREGFRHHEGLSAKDAAHIAGSREQADALSAAHELCAVDRSLNAEIVRNLIAIKDSSIHLTDRIFEAERRQAECCGRTREMVIAEGDKTRELLRQQANEILSRENLDLREGQRLAVLQNQLLAAMGKVPVV